jgi:hypothetical protein
MVHVTRVELHIQVLIGLTGTGTRTCTRTAAAR